ncbi:MAG: DUF4105 domain-containing protein [Tenuifilaceae bacterium]
MMKRKLTRLLFIFFLIALSYTGNASQKNNSEIQLSDSAMISLLTCSAGDELYSIFGHSAIRVNDPLNKLDIVFNYGTFDFSDPNFYPNFIKGHLNYILSASYFRDFEMAYSFENRSITEQILNISLLEKQKLVDSLFVNYQPQNRYYLYDFFGDNCATRIRNVFVEAIPRKIVFDYSSFTEGQSFRQLLMPNLTYKPWAKLGINLLLGIPADKIATPWEYMYLPEHLDKAFQHASFITDSSTQSFAQKPQIILGNEQSEQRMIWWAPQWLFIIIFLIAAAISYRDSKKGMNSFWFDRFLLISAGLLGVLFTFLWAGTAHHSMVWNLNLLWANPIHLIIAFFLTAKKFKKWIKLYAKINFLILLPLLVFWAILPQSLPWVIYPVVMAIALRMFVVTRYY